MREFFAIAMTVVKAKDQHITMHVFLNQIVTISPVEGGTEIVTTTGKIVVKETVEDILRRAGTYGLLKAV